MQKAEPLVELSGTRRRDLIDKFRILDEKIRRLAAARAQSVAAQASGRIRSAQDNVESSASEVGILRYELQKKKRVRPLRKLFAEIPHVLQALKPCMLMSPISVSTYLKPGVISFDVVVFDEASQLPTAEAIPSILRAQRVVVAGDANQLPPTSFFEAALMTEEEPEEEDTGAQEPLESLLDDCVAIVPVFQECFLRWHYRPERVFVKSLENVQGDERDTMLISVGYGKDSSGGLSYNFGPINSDGGWRRLNVLVTRAKWETMLVTSLRSEELGGVNPHNRGVVSLRNFIAFAEQRTVLPSDEAILTAAETNDFEDAVREVLLERGFTVDSQVGTSRYRIDLAIRGKRDPSRYLIGIECDGATYHGSRTARDRDILRQEVLHGMGWRLHRVWSTEWFHDRERAIDSMLKSIEQAESMPPSRPIVHAPPGGETDTPDLKRPGNTKTQTPPASRRYSPGVPYQMYVCRPIRSRDHILQGAYALTLASAVSDIVGVEGPIHEDLLLERLKELHGIERAGSNVQHNVRRAIQLACNGSVEMRGNFLQTKGTVFEKFRVPVGDIRRPLEHVPQEELELAVLYIVEDQFGMMREQIPQVIARLFGIERLRGESADAIRTSVDALVEKGRLRTSGLQVYIS